MNKIAEFVKYAKSCKGNESGEAQVFCDRLFQAFGHKGYLEAGAELESPVKKRGGRGTRFADLIWKPRVLIEMKKAGENLYHHYKQAFEYWILAVPDRPRYVILCNFTEFWIYDFDKQLDKPIDVVKLDELERRYSALNFLFPENPKPVFGNDWEAVSRDAADKIAYLFNSLTERGINQEKAQRFVLQLVVAMFAEDIQLLPANTIYNLVYDCLNKDQFSYDYFKNLFVQMSSPKSEEGGRFINIPYFNGGIFSKVESIDLNENELKIIGGEDGVSRKDWSKINPSIFGTIFQKSMESTERHKIGAHYTSEADIMRIVTPTIVEPWKEKIHSKRKKLKDLVNLRTELSSFKVLDPACGSGNFLYVAFRELARIEIELMAKLMNEFSYKEINKVVKTTSLLSPKQFYGIDSNSFGVELSKITLMLAKRLALEEARSVLDRKQIELPNFSEEALPLDNLDSNFVCDDALFCEWPKVDAIIGNPPFQSKNKIQQEFGPAYINEIRERFPDVDKRADYCVYWFRLAHEHLENGERAGLVGTNSIRQSNSRIGSLDYIIQNGGTITEAVSSMKWSGDAGVSVSIVNWTKAEEKGEKKLFFQEGNDPLTGWSIKEVKRIGSDLSIGTDVTTAFSIKINSTRGGCYQGQTHGHSGFLLDKKTAEDFLSSNKKLKDVIYPFLVFDDLIKAKDSLPKKCVIDLHEYDSYTAKSFEKPFQRVKKLVLPDREKKAADEEKRNKEALKVNPHAKINNHHANFLKRWWMMSWPRPEMIRDIVSKSRYIVCGQTTKRSIFEFISPKIRPNATLIVFPFEDDYSFGILQSSIHWKWARARGSTLVETFCYRTYTVFDSFVWPQNPTESAVNEVAKAAKSLREIRRTLMKNHNLSLREIYQHAELGGTSELKIAHDKLDSAVRRAYGLKKTDDVLSFLLELNFSVAEKEKSGSVVVGPGLPPIVKDASKYISSDCLKI